MNTFKNVSKGMPFLLKTSAILLLTSSFWLAGCTSVDNQDAQALDDIFYASEQKQLDLQQILYLLQLPESERTVQIKDLEQQLKIKDAAGAKYNATMLLKLSVLLTPSSRGADTKRAQKLLEQLTSTEPIDSQCHQMALILQYFLREKVSVQNKAQQLSQQIQDRDLAIQTLREKIEAIRAIEESLGTRVPQ